MSQPTPQEQLAAQIEAQGFLIAMLIDALETRGIRVLDSCVNAMEDAVEDPANPGFSAAVKDELSQLIEMLRV